MQYEKQKYSDDYMVLYDKKYLGVIRGHIYQFNSPAEASRFDSIDMAREFIYKHHLQEHQVKTVGSKPIKTT